MRRTPSEPTGGTRRDRVVAVLVWATAVAVLVLTAPARAGESAPGCEGVARDEIVARVQARYDAARDLEADFEQSTRSVMLGGSGLGDAAPTRGHVVIAKPGRMRWHYTSPRESLVLSDGESLWIHDVEAKEVTRARVTEGYMAGAALQFLLGDGRLADAFEIELAGCEGDAVKLALQPKEPASYERLALEVDRETGVVRASTIYDLFGNVTRMRFGDMKFDQAPAPDRFVWQPVDGVRVVELEPATTP